ncbi:hypothetical protein D3C81_1323720 [compost metagenome]
MERPPELFWTYLAIRAMLNDYDFTDGLLPRNMIGMMLHVTDKNDRKIVRFPCRS